MAKGMSLDEFKNALSSDATVENDRLKDEIKKLKNRASKEIKELKEDVHEYKNQCIALGNRCFVFTQGTMCLNCSVECCEHAFAPADLDASVNYMIKNRMPRTEETREKVNRFLDKRRNNRTED